MLKNVISICAKNRYLTLIILAVFVGMGVQSMFNINIDAIPDLSDTQVIVYSQWNVSPDIIEDQVTYPIVTSLLGAPKVKDIRGISTFGASFVYVIFEDGTDLYWARSRVIEYLSKIRSVVPEEVQIELGPDATGVGWIYQYALVDESGNNTLDELRSFQDWFLRYQLQSIDGVAEVASFGGYQKQFQVLVHPERLRAYGIPLQSVAKAIREGNNETGAKVIESSGTEYMVRLKGYAKNIEQIENIVISSSESGVPISIKNVAQVVEGPAMRRGVGDLDGKGDTVGGIVIMRYGENAYDVIQNVKRKLSELSHSLPVGAKVVETYDRSELIVHSVQTLVKELSIEMLAVGIVILVFLLHFPSAIIPIIVLPSAVIISFIIMRLFNISANIMSLGGIAISIGAMVDAAIVVVENCHKKMEHWLRHPDGRNRLDVVIEAIGEVGTSSFYSLLVIAISFLPIFALEDQEGRLFKPLAYTKTLVMILAAVLSVTLVPALIALFFSQKKQEIQQKNMSFLKRMFSGIYRSEEDHPISQFLFKTYTPVVNYVVEKRVAVIVCAVLVVLATTPIYFLLGKEFMPPLNEGTVLYMPTTMPGLSIGEASQLLQRQGEILKSFPEVKSVHGKAGRADTATDSAPLTMMETVIQLKDSSQWREGRDWKTLVQEMNEAMNFPGLTNAWTQPIKGRIDMLTTGIRTPVGIKISGGDLMQIEKVGIQIEKEIQNIEGTRSVFAERVTGGFFFDILFEREKLARHGISIMKAHSDVSLALGGKNLTSSIQGRERYDIHLRYARAFREDSVEIEKILLDSPKGYPIPLSEVAHISVASGPGVIRNENGLLTSYVYVDIEGSDVGGYVERAKQRLSQSIDMPAGTSIHWSGQFESIKRVRDRMKVLLPITLVLIILLIYLNTGSGIKTSIVLLSIPFSAVGAIWLLFILDYNMSIAVWVGLIALLGIDAEMAIYMLLYLDLEYEKKKKSVGIKSFDEIRQVILAGAVQRVRPKVMTVLTTFFALFPILLVSQDSTGADVMKRMAAPMVGGIFTSFLLELLVYPAIYAVWKKSKLDKL